MIKQITMYEVMNPDDDPPPVATGDKVFRIPDEVWENRCRICVHKRADKNIPCDMAMIDKPMNEDFIPCRVLRLARFNNGECGSFAIRPDTPGFCCSCEHDNIFCPGYCMKPDHGPERQIIRTGMTYHVNDDYYGRHILSVCDDYKPKRK